MIFASVYILFTKYKPTNDQINSNSKETFILINNWFMMFYLITVLLGTIYPIFTDALTDNKISVGPPFYNAIIFPVVVVFLLFMALGPKAKWIKNKFENIRIYFLILIGAICLNLAIIFFFKSYSLLSNFIIISAIFLIISSSMDIAKAIKKNKLDFARIISHTSFGFLVLFIGLNDIFSVEKDYNIKLGETKKFENYSIQLQNLDLKKNATKAERKKKHSFKNSPLNNSQSSEKKSAVSKALGEKVSQLKTDTLTQTSTNIGLSKDLNLESDLLRQPLTLTNKLDTVSNFVQSNMQKPSLFNQENNDKLLQNLNMLSKSWGTDLIEKIEKSIVDGVEKIEISLIPKSLGRLNVTINMQDTIAKISITTESANAATILADAEAKLSQMMEVSGLKLASLQTQANQFGGNQKGKGNAHKLASTVKKTNIEDSSKPMEDINKLDSKNEGLNLIA